MPGENCSTGCLTKDHESFGSCVRSKNLKSAVSIPGKDYDRSLQPSWDKRINAYKQARSEGIQPQSTRSADIQKAVAISDATGTAHQAI